MSQILKKVIQFYIENTAQSPISGQIRGGLIPYEINNLQRGRPVMDSIKALAPTASHEALFRLAYHDSCFPGAPVTAEFLTEVTARYYVTLRNFWVTTARSPVFDTILVMFSAHSGDQEGGGPKAIYAGNVHSGDGRYINLRLGPFDIVPRDETYLTFDYVIANSENHDVQKAASLLSRGAGLLGGALAGGWSGAGIGALTTIFSELIQGTCDGLVAGDHVHIQSFTLDELTNSGSDIQAGGAYGDTRTYIGTEPSLICRTLGGSTSNYQVYWYVVRQPLPKVVIEGSNQIQVAANIPSSRTMTYQLVTEEMQPPFKSIRWSNGATSESTEYIFQYNGIQPGDAESRDVSVRVTDANDMTAEAHLSVTIFAPEHPSCKPGFHYDEISDQCVRFDPITP